MTNAEMFSLIMARFGGRTSSALRASVVTEMNMLIDQLEQGATLPWFLQEEATGNCVASQEYIDLPSDFLREVEDGMLQTQNSDGDWESPLAKMTLDKLRKATQNADPALPEGYALFGSRFYLGPAPDSTYAYRFQYYAASADVADNSSAISNPWLLYFFNYITLQTAFNVVSMHIQSAELAQKMTPALTLARNAFTVAVEARENANLEQLLTDSET